MIEVKLNEKESAIYDEDNNVVLINGKPNQNWKPTFVENGNDEPTFFGVIDLKNQKCYNIYGNVSKVSQEDGIKL